jgi:hypothetical protein
MKTVVKLFIVLTYLTVHSAFAEQVSAYVSASKVGVEDAFTLTIEAKNYNGIVEFPQIYDFDNFDMVSGPVQGQNMSWINGKVTKLLTHKYTLMPKKTGVFTIPSFTVKIDDRVYKTKPIEVTVVKGSLATQSQRSPRSFFDDDFFSPRPRRSRVTKRSVFVKAEVDKTAVYVNEGITVSYRLYFNRPVSSPGFKDVPDFTGFVTEDVATPSRIKTETKLLNGERYNTAVIFQKILYPISAGKLVIPSITFSLRVEDPMSFFSAGTVIYRKSSPVEITVLPFPEPQPDNFSGAIGTFTVISSVDKDRLKTGDSLTYKLTIRGKGNLNPVSSVFPKEVKGFKVFKPGNPVTTHDKRDPKLIEKTWEIVLVPEKTGRLSIPEIPFVYFDPVVKQYVTKTTIKREVEVEQGLTSLNQTVTESGRAVTMLTKDIEYIETDLPVDNIYFIDRSMVYKSVLYGAPVLFLLLGFIFRFTDPARKSLKEYRRVNAFKFFKKNLKEAEKLLKKKKNKEYYSAISSAVIRYFSDKFNKPNIELRIDEIELILKERQIEEGLIRSLVDIVEYCDFESYTPSATGQNIKILDETREIIGKLEKLL